MHTVGAEPVGSCTSQRCKATRRPMALTSRAEPVEQAGAGLRCQKGWCNMRHVCRYTTDSHPMWPVGSQSSPVTHARLKWSCNCVNPAGQALMSPTVVWCRWPWLTATVGNGLTSGNSRLHHWISPHVNMVARHGTPNLWCPCVCGLH